MYYFKNKVLNYMLSNIDLYISLYIETNEKNNSVWKGQENFLQQNRNIYLFKSPNISFANSTSYIKFYIISTLI